MDDSGWTIQDGRFRMDDSGWTIQRGKMEDRNDQRNMGKHEAGSALADFLAGPMPMSDFQEWIALETKQ